MELLHPRCAGLDVSKRDAKVCVRVAGEGRARATSTVTTWGSMTNQVLAMREHLDAEQVTLVVMETPRHHVDGAAGRASRQGLGRDAAERHGRADLRRRRGGRAGPERGDDVVDLPESVNRPPQVRTAIQSSQSVRSRACPPSP